MRRVVPYPVSHPHLAVRPSRSRPFWVHRVPFPVEEQGSIVPSGPFDPPRTLRGGAVLRVAAILRREAKNHKAGAPTDEQRAEGHDEEYHQPEGNWTLVFRHSLLSPHDTQTANYGPTPFFRVATSWSARLQKPVKPRCEAITLGIPLAPIVNKIQRRAEGISMSRASCGAHGLVS